MRCKLRWEIGDSIGRRYSRDSQKKNVSLRHLKMQNRYIQADGMVIRDGTFRIS